MEEHENFSFPIPLENLFSFFSSALVLLFFLFIHSVMSKYISILLKNYKLNEKTDAFSIFIKQFNNSILFLSQVLLLEYSRLAIVFSPQPLHLEKGKQSKNVDFFFFPASQQYNIISKPYCCKDDPKCPMQISGLH